MAQQLTIEQLSQARSNVLDFLRKKKKEKEERGERWEGYYHNGGPNVEPTVEITLSQNGNHVNATYCAGNRMMNFVFPNEEI